MKLTTVDVIGLFGTFNHRVILKDNNITLLTGANGIGKTVILKMIKSFFEADFGAIMSNKFDQLILKFTDDTEVEIIRMEKLDETIEFTEGSETKEIKLSISHKSKEVKPFTYPIDPEDGDIKASNFNGLNPNLYKEDLYRYFRQFLPRQIERHGLDKWLDLSNAKIYSTREILSKYRKSIPSRYLKYFINPIPKWLLEYTSSLKIKLIETQRLSVKANTNESTLSVLKYSEELIELIKNETVAATDLASKLDRSYPTRIVKRMTRIENVSDVELENGLAKLNQRRDLLNEVGLLGAPEEELISVSNAIRNQTGHDKALLREVFQVYLEDSNQKLTMYDELAKKMILLVKIINNRLLFKRISISKEKGFVITSLKTGKEIPLAGLSSGEQHELVLFYQLLFTTESSSLLMIDEPEISLHITWQNQFINDLIEVIQLKNFFALIATHSPDIINNRWELVVQLSGE